MMTSKKNNINEPAGLRTFKRFVQKLNFKVNLPEFQREIRVSLVNTTKYEIEIAALDKFDEVTV